MGCPGASEVWGLDLTLKEVSEASREEVLTSFLKNFFGWGLEVGKLKVPNQTVFPVSADRRPPVLWPSMVKLGVGSGVAG